MVTFKRCFLLGMMGVWLLVAAACDTSSPEAESSSQKRATPAYGDTLILGMSADPANLLPVLASDSASSSINGWVYNGLVRYDEHFRIEPVLAKSWDISEDQKTITFHLRRDVTWHDGEPFTSADVLFTYKLYTDPDTPTAYAERYLQVEKATAPDPYTFRVTYAKPLATALISWAVAIHPQHLLAGKDVTESQLSRQPVGTGPYRFVSWEPGEKVELKANADYFEGEPYIQRLVYRVIPDATTTFLQLQSGGLDYMQLTPLQYARQTDSPGFKRRFHKYRYPSFSYTYLGYNLRKPMFQQRQVRQALSYAINKQELIQGVLYGLGQVATGPYVPDTWPYNPEVKRYAYNPDKARAMLKAAGWVDTDEDGVRERDGQEFAFTIMTNQGNDKRVKAGEIIQRRLQQVGVKVKLRVVEWAVFLKEFIHPGRFDATIMGWTVPIDPDGYNVWHSSKTGQGQLNFIGYSDPEVDRLLEKGRRTLKREERQRIYHRIHAILARQQPYTFLYVPDALPVVATRVHGIKPTEAGIMHNLIRWYVPQGQQKYQR